MRLIRKVVMAGLSCYLIISSSLLFGCSNELSEDAIKDSVTTQLDAFKNKDDTALEFLEASANPDSINAITGQGISNESMEKAMLEGFDYSIESIDFADGTAEVLVSITCKDTSGLDERISKISSEMEADSESLTLLSEAELAQLMESKTLEAINGLPTKKKIVTISYELNDKKWSLSNDAMESVASLLIFQEG